MPLTVSTMDNIVRENTECENRDNKLWCCRLLQWEVRSLHAHCSRLQAIHHYPTILPTRLDSVSNMIMWSEEESAAGSMNRFKRLVTSLGSGNWFSDHFHKECHMADPNWCVRGQHSIEKTYHSSMQQTVCSLDGLQLIWDMRLLILQIWEKSHRFN